MPGRTGMGFGFGAGHCRLIRHMRDQTLVILFHEQAPSVFPSIISSSITSSCCVPCTCLPSLMSTAAFTPLRSIQHSMCSSHHLGHCYITSVGRSRHQTITKPSDMKACYNTYHIPFQSSTNLCCTLPYLKHHFMGRSVSNHHKAF